MPVKVWDLGVRLFHWSLALLIIANLLLGGDEAGLYTVHVYLGYIAGLLVVFRVVWGFIGSRHARFGDFLVGPGKALRYGGELARGEVKPHVGHTPLGGYMILALLLIVLVQVATGILAAERLRWAREVHEILVSVFWVLIGLHLAGVLLHSWRAKDNIVRPMITGRKSLTPHQAAREPQVRGARPILITAVVVLLIGALLAWQIDLPGLAVGGRKGSGAAKPVVETQQTGS